MFNSNSIQTILFSSETYRNKFELHKVLEKNRPKDPQNMNDESGLCVENIRSVIKKVIIITRLYIYS